MYFYRSGFTLIEVMVTLIAMVILLSLGVAGVGSLQAQARDKERANDVAVIARGLEGYYKNGNPLMTSQAQNAAQGTYPGYNVVRHMEGVDLCSSNLGPALNPCNTTGTPYFDDALPGVSEAARTPPGKPGPYFKTKWLISEADAVNLINDGAYVYTATQKNGTDCYGDPNEPPCLHFTIRYKEETSGNIITVKGQH